LIYYGDSDNEQAKQSKLQVRSLHFEVVLD